MYRSERKVREICYLKIKQKLFQNYLQIAPSVCALFHLILAPPFSFLRAQNFYSCSSVNVCHGAEQGQERDKTQTPSWPQHSMDFIESETRGSLPAIFRSLLPCSASSTINPPRLGPRTPCTRLLIPPHWHWPGHSIPFSHVAERPNRVRRRPDPLYVLKQKSNI